MKRTFKPVAALGKTSGFLQHAIPFNKLATPQGYDTFRSWIFSHKGKKRPLQIRESELRFIAYNRRLQILSGPFLESFLTVLNLESFMVFFGTVNRYSYLLLTILLFSWWCHRGICDICNRKIFTRQKIFTITV